MIFRNDFKDYSLQSRLHFRIHSAQTDLRSREKSAKKVTGAGTGNGSTPESEADDVLPICQTSNGTENKIAIPRNEEEAAKIIGRK